VGYSRNETTFNTTFQSLKSFELRKPGLQRLMHRSRLAEELEA